MKIWLKCKKLASPRLRAIERLGHSAPMATLVIDTYRISQKLQSKGYTKDQAEGFIETLQDLDLESFATKEDIRSVKADIDLLKGEIREMALRLKLHLGAMIFALGGVLVAVKFLG
jgi:hypothetical protein